MSGAATTSHGAGARAPEGVLITGSAGRVGRVLVEAFRDRYRLRGFDRVPTPNLDDHAVGDVGDLEALTAACAGVDAVVHLAGCPSPSAPWDEILRSNIVGTHNALEAARRAGVRRFVFSSRAGLVQDYPDDQLRTVDLARRPTDYYSVGKCLGEDLGYMYWRRHGLEFVSVRIGHFTPERPEPTHPHHLGRADLVRVFERALEQPDVGHAIVFGVSDSSHRMYDLDHGERALGYVPEQRSRWSPHRMIRALNKVLRWPRRASAS